MAESELTDRIKFHAAEDDSWPTRSEQSSMWGLKRRTHKWRPATDVYETDTSYQVRVEIAGMRGSDISVTFERQTLVIQGARIDAGPQKAYHQLEIAYGEFETAIQIPESVEVSKIEASYVDGFLRVELPKLKPKPKRALIEE